MAGHRLRLWPSSDRQMDILDMERAGSDYSDNRGERKIIYTDCWRNLLAFHSTFSPESYVVRFLWSSTMNAIWWLNVLRIKQKQPEEIATFQLLSFERSFSLKCSILKNDTGEVRTKLYSFFARFMHLQLYIPFHHFSLPFIYRITYRTERALGRISSFPFLCNALCKRGRGIGSWKGSLHCYLLSERIIIIGVYILSTLLLLQIALRFHNICQGWGSWILLLLRIDSSDDFSHPGLWSDCLSFFMLF